ncbi:unnamed protein product [Trichobilharzia regenti]|nr:unnamed protein product [Trichobilharzia regenti]
MLFARGSCSKLSPHFISRFISLNDTFCLQSESLRQYKYTRLSQEVHVSKRHYGEFSRNEYVNCTFHHNWKISLGHSIITEDCLSSIVENKQYYEMPILHLSARKNNLIATLTDCNGRSVLSGLNISGLKIISLTDDTNVHYGHGRRPRKPRRM